MTTSSDHQRAPGTGTSPLRDLGTVKDAAEYAKVDPATIRRWIRAGKHTRYYASSRVVRLDLAEVDALFQPAGKA